MSTLTAEEHTAVYKAGLKFSSGISDIRSLGSGLIHRTYKLECDGSEAILLQRLNRNTFRYPENIIHNYQLIEDELKKTDSSIRIPHLLKTIYDKYYWIDPVENFWRATQFIKGSFTYEQSPNEMQILDAAECFGKLTASLSGLSMDDLNIIIPDFHNLNLRYHQFEEAINKGPIQRLLRATHVISELRDRKHLVTAYDAINDDREKFPLRIMHHDCKISNILFDETTRKVICPIDLDTVMPGLFFSDLGDMIRTMACTENEDSTSWEKIDIVQENYRAIITGYLQSINSQLTDDEKQSIHKSGVFVIYMQCLRFVTDYINHDIYYHTSYPEQNLNRALNQLILLERLEEYLESNPA